MKNKDKLLEELIAEMQEALRDPNKLIEAIKAYTPRPFPDDEEIDSIIHTSIPWYDGETMSEHVTEGSKYSGMCSHCRRKIREGDSIISFDKLFKKQGHRVHVDCFRKIVKEVYSEPKLPEPQWFDGGEI